MIVSVRVAVLLCLAFVSSQVSAAPYAFFQGENNVSATITLEHHETPYAACKGTEGLLYATALTVAAASYAPGSGVCAVVLDDGTAATVTVVGDSGSCPDDVAFDFARQTCDVLAGPTQLYAVTIAMYAWLCLIGGLLVGYRFGA